MEEYGEYEENTTSGQELDILQTNEPQEESTETSQEEIVTLSERQKFDIEQICMEKTKLDKDLRDLVKYFIFVEPMTDYLMCVMRDSKSWLPATGFSMPHIIGFYKLKDLSDELVKDIIETCIDKNKNSEDLVEYVVSLQCCIIDCIFREQGYAQKEKDKEETYRI